MRPCGSGSKQEEEEFRGEDGNCLKITTWTIFWRRSGARNRARKRPPIHMTLRAAKRRAGPAARMYRRECPMCVPLAGGAGRPSPPGNARPMTIRAGGSPPQNRPSGGRSRNIPMTPIPRPGVSRPAAGSPAGMFLTAKVPPGSRPPMRRPPGAGNPPTKMGAGGKRRLTSRPPADGNRSGRKPSAGRNRLMTKPCGEKSPPMTI